MTRAPFALLCTAVAALAAPPASAQNVKPGLWEIQHQMRSASGDSEKAMARLQEQMAKMPPEQRKAMQDMMAKQGVGMGPKGSSMRFCMSKEMAERGPAHQAQPPQSHCQSTASPRLGNTVKFSYTCTQPPSSGEGEVTYKGDTAYTMKMVSTTTRKGQPETMTMEAQGQWLGADCGDLKPLDQMRPPTPPTPPAAPPKR